jgi:hypothetical protein
MERGRQINIGFKIINSSYGIGRHGIPIQLAHSNLAKLIILKPIKAIVLSKRVVHCQDNAVMSL